MLQGTENGILVTRDKMTISRSLLLVSAIVALSTVAFAQPGAIPAPINPGVLAPAYQVNVLTNGSNVLMANLYVTNVGALGTGAASPSTTGSICVNMYTYGAAQKQMRCCSCLVQPNAVAVFPVSQTSTTN